MTDRGELPMRTPAFGFFMLLGFVGAVAANGTIGCTYTASGQGADAAASTTQGPPGDDDSGTGVPTGGEDSSTSLPPGDDGSIGPSPGEDSSTGTHCGQSPQPRGGTAIAYDSVRGVTVLFGGCQGTNCNSGPYLGDTWEWNGTSWSEVATGNGPSARATGSMVFDQANDVTVFFGGGINSNETDYNDTWTWNGKTWNEVVPNGAAGSPPARNGAGMVWDTSQNVAVLFGGNVTGFEQLSDTWEWNGDSWSNVTPSSGPAARCYFPMIYDQTNSVVMLWGGCSSSGCSDPLSDTWTWNGSTWTERSGGGGGQAPQPGAPGIFSMAYNASTSQGILYGASPASSTWGWNGVWTEFPPSGGSPPATNGVLAYDSQRNVVVYFGGATATGTPLAQTWEWSGNSWQNLTPPACP
jgi:hypothetical protein